jgi:hypothetical protein
LEIYTGESRYISKKKKKKKKHSNREVVEDRFYIFTLQILEEKWFEECGGDALIAIFFINLFYFFLFFI